MATLLEIRQAVKALHAAAAPNARVMGFERDDSRPSRGDPGGVILGELNPAELVDTDLSPLTYYYDLPFIVQLMPPMGMSDDDATAWLAATTGAIGAGILADRSLGGRAEWIEADPASEESATPPNADQQRWMLFELRVQYATHDPLN
jgi:hypothetical protein